MHRFPLTLALIWISSLALADAKTEKVRLVTSPTSRLQDVLQSMKESGKSVRINDFQGKIVGLSETLVEIDLSPQKYETAVVPLAEIKSATLSTAGR